MGKNHYVSLEKDDVLFVNGEKLFVFDGEGFQKLMSTEETSIHKVTFEDGLRLDGVRVKGITKYELDGEVDEVSTLKLELLVDDSELFKKEEYQFKPLAD